MKTINKLGIALAAAALTVASHAVPITTLLTGTGGTLTEGDKIFSDFTWSGPTGPQGIEILGINEGGLYGIRIQGMSITDPGTYTWNLTYAVETALGSGMLISDVHQRYATGNGGNMASKVDEYVYANPSHTLLLAESHIAGYDQIDPPGELTDTLNLLYPRQKVWITKTITATLPDQTTTTGPKTLIVKQQFSQVPVPDGGTTVMLLGFVMAALGFAHRKLS